MRLKYFLKKILPGTVLLAFVSGCAVLTVDVDVYKGSLANHEDVQTEQLASMAMGAKPLLIQLRDHLEWGLDSYNPKFLHGDEALEYRTGENLQEHLADVRTNSTWYRAGFIPPTGHLFRNERADVVNSILSLYEEKSSSQLGSLVQEGYRALNDYEQNYNAFRGDRRAQDLELWNTLAKARIGDRKIKDMSLWNAYSNLCVQGIGSNWRVENDIFRIHQAITDKSYDEIYTNIYAPGRYFTNQAVVANKFVKAVTNTDSSVDSFYTNSFLAKEFFTNQPAITNQLCKTDLRLPETLNEPYAYANERFVEFVQRGMLQEDADLFFGTTNNTSKQQFVANVQNLSANFRRSREALDKLLRIALTALTEVNADSSLNDCDCQDKVKDALAELVAYIIQLDLLREAKYEATNRIDTFSCLDTLNTPFDFLNKSLSDDDARSLLKKALLDKSRVFAFALLRLDVAAIEWSRQPGFKQFTFGLVRGPTKEFGDGVQIQRIKDMLDDIPASGLERGRLDIGLETMIDDYLKLEHNAIKVRDDAFLARSREQLLAGLVNFSEKVIFISNYGTLLDSSSDSKVKGYLMVLQAVGNSILNQADELHQQGQYKDGQQRQAASVIAAATKVFGTNIDNFTNAPDAKTALAQLTAALRLEYINELKQGNTTISTNDTVVINTIISTNLVGVTNVVSTNTVVVTNLVSGVNVVTTNLVFSTNVVGGVHELATNTTTTVTRSSTSRANSLQAAIEAATEMKSGEIYLRPASAYLRNSYPATSLQNGTPVFWQNMLQDHAFRQLPFSQQLKELANPNPLAAGEIDKAFWQNINRVRVAGAGDVNYVIVKDDVGNWYVKQFSTDSSNVVNSAKNLALFAAGPSLGANFPITKGDGTVLSGSAGANGVTGTSVLDRQFTQALTGYTNDSATIYNQLIDAATNLVSARLVPAWKGISETNLTTLMKLATVDNASGFTNFPPSAEAVLKKNTDASRVNTVVSDKTDELLKEIKRYNYRLSRAITADTSNSNLVDTVKTTAQAAAQREIRDLLKEYIGKRESAIKGYESQLNLIGGAASP